MFEWLTGNVDPSGVRKDLLRGINTGAYRKTGNELVGQGMDFLKGKGPILDMMRNRMRGDIYDQSSMAGDDASQMISRMGGGGGGQGTIMRQLLTNRAGENVRKGGMDLLSFGQQQGGNLLSQGQGFWNQGNQYLGAANTAMAQQKAQNMANIAGLTQQFMKGPMGMLSRGMESGMEKFPWLAGMATPPE